MLINHYKCDVSVCVSVDGEWKGTVGCLYVRLNETGGGTAGPSQVQGITCAQPEPWAWSLWHMHCTISGSNASKNKNFYGAFCSAPVFFFKSFGSGKFNLTVGEFLPEQMERS